MRVFIDTANIEDIRRGAALGVVDGVSTIPSLVVASIRHPRHVTEAALAGARRKPSRRSCSSSRCATP